VAHLIERACLEYPQRFGQFTDLGGNQLADDFVQWAKWVRDEVTDDLAAVFPASDDGRCPAIYFWCRTMRCPDPGCSREIPLVTSRGSRTRPDAKPGSNSTLRACDLNHCATSGEPANDPSVGTIKASSATCPACGASAKATEVREYAQKIGLGAQLYAVLDIDGNLRTYRVPTQREIDGAFVAASLGLAKLPELDDGTSSVPDEQMVKSQYRRYGNLVYGIDTFAKMFNSRQLFVLGRLAQGVRDAHGEMLNRASILSTRERSRPTSRSSSTRSLTTTRRLRHGCRRGQFQRDTFPRQAVAMVWDYVETDPFRGDDKGIGPTTFAGSNSPSRTVR